MKTKIKITIEGQAGVGKTQFAEACLKHAKSISMSAYHSEGEPVFSARRMAEQCEVVIITTQKQK